MLTWNVYDEMDISTQIQKEQIDLMRKRILREFVF